MFISFTFTTFRDEAMNRFQYEHSRAQMNSLRALLLGRSEHLDSFGAHLPDLLPSRRYQGIQEIPVAQIVGSVDRNKDFDHSFRPLKSHLRDRWVNIYLLAQKSGWLPIRVYEVGGRYFVEDGHHRVSVARALGLSSIQAEVWKYMPRPIQMGNQRCCLLAYTCK